MRRERTNSCTAARKEIYEKASGRASTLLSICHEILENGKTEAQACRDAGVPLDYFRRFCRTIPETGIRDHLTISETDWNLDWREALLLSVTGEQIPAPDDFDEVFSDICEKDLTHGHALVLKKLIDGYTLNAIGKELGLSAERVRQMEARAIRILRHPKRRLRLAYGNEYYKALEARNNAQDQYDLLYLNAQDAKKKGILKEMRELKEEVKGLNRAIETLSIEGKTVTSKERKMLSTRVSDLPLCTRIQNALKRAVSKNQEIGEVTAYEVAGLSVEDLMRIRNLGRSGIEEIKACFRQEFGFIFPDKSY